MVRYEYDVAFSMAGEDRPKAERLLLRLLESNVRVFYDKLEEHELWGKDLAETLHEIFAKKARYCVMFVSKHYLEKRWPRHERRSAMERAIADNTEYILPLRIDDTELPGLPSTVGYLRYSDEGVDHICKVLLRKLRRAPGTRDLSPEVVPTAGASMATIPEEHELGISLSLMRHQSLSMKLLPLRESHGYYALHTIPAGQTEVPVSRLSETFLDRSKNYSETLLYSATNDAHQDGFTRRYEVSLPDASRTTADAVTCFFDGHIVTEGYLDSFLEGSTVFHPSWFAYEVQRHLQLSKEVLDGLVQNIALLIRFEHIERFGWAIYRANQIERNAPYAGYHSDVRIEVALSDIAGRDKWNVVMPAVEQSLAIVARIFGMDRLPQAYWNEAGELDFVQGISGR